MKLISTILLLFCSFGVFSQKEITWDDLRCEIEEVWSEEFQGYFIKPKFEEKHTSLNSSKIKIKGYITLIDDMVDYYTLSLNQNPFEFHYSKKKNFSQLMIMELQFNSKPNDINMKKEYWVEGILILNEDDILQLNYILKDAVIVEK